MGNSILDKLPFADAAVSGRGCLFVVATPIGNLNDITFRALEVLKQADLVAAEDTRHSGHLLDHFGIRTPMISLHDHNEESRVAQLIAALEGGKKIALISDAGTPLISDPGFRLVRAVRGQGYVVTPVPGACAAITALCASGLPTDRFLFAGFAPSRQQARQRFLEALLPREETMIFYESPKRITEFLDDAIEVMGAEREACVAKELTKMFERFVTGSLAEIRQTLEATALQRGEFVVMIAGAPAREASGVLGSNVTADQALLVATRYLPPKQACALVAELTGSDKKLLYQQWISHKGEE